MLVEWMFSSVYVQRSRTGTVPFQCSVVLFHEDALFLFQIKTADATTHVTAPSARYKFMLS
jgi:hypothetical protein